MTSMAKAVRTNSAIRTFVLLALHFLHRNSSNSYYTANAFAAGTAAAAAASASTTTLNPKPQSASKKVVSGFIEKPGLLRVEHEADGREIIARV